MRREAARGASLDLAEVSRSLGVSLEFLLSGVLADDNGHWCDGIELVSVNMGTNGELVIRGTAWCCDHKNQWLVPCEAIIMTNSDAAHRLQACEFRIGDSRAGSLRGHRSFTSAARPSQWLRNYSITNPPTSLDAIVEGHTARVMAWIKENPGGQIVQEDWTVLTSEEALSLVRDLVTGMGREPIIDETWLEGRAALWVR